MAGGLTVSVRQIGSYPSQAALPSDLVLIQRGLGGPYLAPSLYQAVIDTLASGGPVGIGYGPIPSAQSSTLFINGVSVPANGGGLLYNFYFDTAGTLRYWGSGLGGGAAIDNLGNFSWTVAPAGVAQQPVEGLAATMLLSVAGGLSLPRGTLTVARDPASALEVATMQWVGNQTVAAFNGRKGVVTLQASDIYAALGICPPDSIATCASVDAAICAAIQSFIQTYPSVWSWMGRVGDVFLTVADINYAAANNPSFMPVMTIPAPPLTAVDGEVVTASWVLGLLGASPPGYATEAWVTQYVAQNTVTSFNGRVGVVTLSLADITGAGGAPIASPNFSGVPSAPTAAPGSNTGQLATTAFVQAAISSATAGVASFNGRTGTVVLTAPDVSGVGGILNPSAALSGVPTAPTAAVGNSSTQIATTAFVAAAVAAAGGVTSFNTRTGAITFVANDITAAGGALLASPSFTGTPTAPTAAGGTNNTQIATTAFVNAAISSIGIGVTSFEGRTGAVTLLANDISAAGGLINPSVALSGVPTAPTAAAGTSSTQIATTAFVNAAILAGSVTTFNGRAGAVTLSGADISGAGGALLASPTFTGTPQAPTAAPGTNTTQLATTAFVTGALATQAANSVTSFNGRQGVVTLVTGDITGAGGAPIASPTFTGVPAVPTATAGTSTTQAASTAFVMNAIAASTAGVTSFNSRTGAVTLLANDVSAVGGALLASPQFTGTPTSPTPTAGDNSTNIATTAFVAHALSTAAVQSFNGRTGVVTLQASDISGASGLLTTGGTMTGALTLAGNATSALQPVTLQQLQAGYLPLSGGTLTGALSISGTGNGLSIANGSITVAGGSITAPFYNTTNNANAGYAFLDRTTGVNWLWSASGGTASLFNSTLGGNAISITTAGNTTIAGTLGCGSTVQPLSNNATWCGLPVGTGNAWYGVAAYSFAQQSDATTKNTIADYAPGVSIAAQLSPKTFIYNEDPANVQHLGFIAQDVEPLIPDAIIQPPVIAGMTGTLSLDLTAIVAVLANAVKQLIARVAALESNASITPTAAETA